MQLGLYLHRRSVDVWRVVSEDSDQLFDQSFLLIDCTGRIVTARRGTTGYSVIPAYSQILLRQRSTLGPL